MYRILIVEDEVLPARGLAGSLKNLGYEVIGMVSSAEEAVQIVEESKPDLVLIDIKLEGGIDGIEAADRIRSRFDIPVVYMTGYAEEAQQQAHDELERRVEERTTELQEMNEKLRLEIRKREEASEALKEKEERYRLLTENSLTGIYIHQDGILSFVNDRLAAIIGYTPEEMIGKEFWEFVHPDYKEMMKRRGVARSRGKAVTPSNYEFRAICKNGDVRWLEILATTISYHGGTANMGNIADIDDRKRAEEKLLQAHDELEQRVDERTAELRETNEQLRNEVSDRKKAEEEVKASLKEKEVLLREIHHRVKNNLAVISSLLVLQSGYATDESHRKMFEDAEARVRSMAMAHEKLYQSESLAALDIPEYVNGLADHLIDSTGLGYPLEIRKDIEDVSFGIDTAIPLGFILTELLSNCLKHAFPDGREGEIRIVLRSVGAKEFELVVSDNGVGMPKDIDLENPESLGWDLVNAFAGKIEGAIEIRREEGTEVRIRFKEPKPKKRRAAS